MVETQDLRATWSQALLTFLFPVLVIVIVRWLFFEPYVIPSGSMIPTLLVNDHVLVNKLAYGVRLPLTDYYLFRWGEVKRGDIIVFRYPKDPKFFYVKRVIAVQGDQIEWEGVQYKLNGVWVNHKPLGDDLYQERDYILQYQNEFASGSGDLVIPQGEVFVLGDHRDQSLDSRFWGTVKESQILGKLVLVWLSCDELIDPNFRLCDPRKIRWDRLGLRPK